MHAHSTSTSTVRVVSVEQAREHDRLAGEEFGIPSSLLMENAASGTASIAMELLSRHQHHGVCVLCGRGNNGGDGYAVARHLDSRGVPVAIVHAGPPSQGAVDAVLNHSIAARMGLAMFDADADAPAEALERAGETVGGVSLIVDAMLGVGLRAQDADGLREPVASLVRECNRLRGLGVSVLAVDVPSGLDAQRGVPVGSGEDAAVRADVTATMLAWKEGFLSAGARSFLGEVVQVPLGTPRSLITRFGWVLDPPNPCDETRTKAEGGDRADR